MRSQPHDHPNRDEMNDKEFDQRKWKSHQEIDFGDKDAINIDGERGVVLPCMLIGIDFAEGLLRLEPFPNDIYEVHSLDRRSFWARYEHCEISKPQLKAITAIKSQA